ncbi:MAG: argininosuccinate lyase [Haloarculaceae archaeon]
MTDGEDEETTDGFDAGYERAAESAVRGERFSSGPARAFLSSLEADERIFRADLAVDRAHVVMLAEQAILDDAVAGEILGALADIETAGHAALPEGEDVQEAIESAVIDRIGPDGGRMHTARSRNDEVAADIRYRLRKDLLETLETVLAARGTLIPVADEESATVMPGYTHLQPAQPVTVGYWAASYERPLARDTARLIETFDRTNRNPLGAGAFGGVAYDVDRERTADLLGFDGVLANGMDAVSTRDFLVETTAALATLATTLSGLAEDLVVFANRGLVDLDDAYASTSSIMPQKKNPDTMELVRGRTGDATAGLNGLLTTLKGLPRAYNRDLQRATTHVWGAVDAVTESADVTAGAVATADWPAEALVTAAGEGFATATGVADLLAQAGVPFRTAHEVVATAADTGFEGPAPGFDALDEAAREVLGDSLGEYVDREDVERVLDPAQSVAMRDSQGGPAAGAMADQLADAEAALETDREALAERRRAVAAAADELETAVSAYV